MSTSSNTSKVLRLDHFIYALFNRVGYKLLKTDGVSKQVCDATLHYLQNVGAHVKSEAYIQVYWPNENVLSVSLVKPVTDEFGREGVWNHTILVPIGAYLQFTQPSRLLSAHFIHGLDDPSITLHPIVVT